MKSRVSIDEALKVHEEFVIYLALSIDRKVCVSGWGDGEIRRWNIEGRELLV